MEDLVSDPSYVDAFRRPKVDNLTTGIGPSYVRIAAVCRILVVALCSENHMVSFEV